MMEKIAKKNKVTPQEARYEMERAIECAWKEGNLKEFFAKKPTIEEFLVFSFNEIKKAK